MINTIKEPVYFLLVDDLEENLLSLEALLRRDGLTILKASSGKEALEYLLEYEVALALLDVQMPDMDGFELAELMRGTERTRRVPIIFVTAGTADRQRRFRGYEAGAVDFLNKPIEPDIIRSKAEVFFELYRQKQLLTLQRDELQKSAEALKDADKRKDEFLATLAHELRNPLAPLKSGLQILKMSPTGQNADEVRDMMDRQLNHLVRLIDDLLDVSRVSQGKIDLRKEKITLQSAIEVAIETSEPIIKAAEHILTVNVPKDAIWLEADLTRLAQVLSNILNNAAKYTPVGGKISLDVSQKDADSVSVAITDNGLGIEEKMLMKVFDLFTQVDNHLERSQGGLGIGLALVKKMVEIHDGIITAESKGINKGSTFTITLPVIHVDGKTDSKAAAAPVIEVAQPLKILLVDDNIPSAKTTGWMLELIGHQPILAHDGPSALQAALELKPDVVMLDIGLPGMNGYEVCRELRKNPEFKDTVMIAQTGWGRDSDRQQAQEAGFDHHLVKPIKLDEVTALLKDLKPKG